jgi:hypothetical protein
MAKKRKTSSFEISIFGIIQLKCTDVSFRELIGLLLVVVMLTFLLSYVILLRQK